MMESDEAKGAAKPPYIAFRTLEDLIQRMSDDGAPPQIDRSYLDNYSGGYGGQVIAALESLDLLEKNGGLKPRLKALIQGDASERKRLFAEILQERYPRVIELGKINATQQQHEDVFREMGVSGDTLRKAVAFYIKAAQFSGVPLSRNFKVPRVRSASGKPARPKPRPESTVNQGGEGGAGGGAGGQPDLPDRIPAALRGLLDKLPSEGEGWEKDDKDRFMTAFTAFIDLFYPLVEPGGVDDPDDY
jgi:hypothetical protein